MSHLPDIRRRIELLQDFTMPHVSNIVKVTKDKQYIMAAGTYKPRLKVYDTNMMSLKYEKIMDSHAIQLLCLEDDYSKVSALDCIVLYGVLTLLEVTT